MVGVAANIFFAGIFFGYGNFALPLAFSLAGILNTVILLGFLKYNLRTLSLKELGVYFLKLLYICTVMILVIILADIFISFDLNFVGSLYQIITLSFIGILTFVTFSSILKFNELRILISRIMGGTKRT